MTTFKSPPAHLPLEHVFDFHAVENPDCIAITHPSNGQGNIKSYAYCDLVPAIHRAGENLAANLNIHSRVSSDAAVVAIILKTDAMTYLTVILGLLRAGFVPLPISDRYPASVIAHILKESPPTSIVLNEATSSLVADSLGQYQHSLEAHLYNLPQVSLATWFSGSDEYNPLPNTERKPGDASIIMHSSSSTSIFPKKLVWSSLILSQRGEIPDLPLQDVAGKVLGCFGMDFSHGYAMSVLSAMVRRGVALSLMDPNDPRSILPGNPLDMYRCFTLMKPGMIFVEPPRVLEDWAEDNDKVEELAKSGANVYYAGVPLKKVIGDNLACRGVKICPVYGSTECGGMVIFPEFHGADWEYLSIYPRPDVKFVPHGESGLYELYVTPPSESSYLACVNASWNGQPAYNTGDLFIQHPSMPNMYKVYGRLDDQILLSSGRMINPIETERLILEHPLVHSATLFGEMRPRLGVIVELASGIDVNRDAKSVIEELWPVLQAINTKLQPTDQVAQEMVLIAKRSKPISISPKGMPRRRLAWIDYQEEINALYSRSEGQL